MEGEPGVKGKPGGHHVEFPLFVDEPRCCEVDGEQMGFFPDEG